MASSNAASSSAAVPEAPHPALATNLSGAGKKVSTTIEETIIIQTSDGGAVIVEKGMLMSSSKFWSDMLSSCDTGRITLGESKDSIELLLRVLNNEPEPCTFNTAEMACWEIYKKVLEVGDKYDMPVVRERVEKWLVSRCLRGKVKNPQAFKFQDIKVGQEWLQLCCKYGLHCLGWFVAYDLGCQLATSGWDTPVTDALQGINDPEMLKTMLEAVGDSAQHSQSPRVSNS